MVPVRFQVVGEEDYAFDVQIDAGGEYRVSGGTYTSQAPRSGRLSAEQEQALRAALEALGELPDYPLPEAAHGFEACLTVGTGEQARSGRFWEGAIEQDARLRRLVRLLETL